MATTNEIKKQGDGKYSVRIGNQKFNGLSLREAQRRSDRNYQVAPDSETDSPAQKARNASRGISVGDSNAVRDAALRNEPLDAVAVGSVNPIVIPQKPVLDAQKGLIAGGNAALTNPQMGVSTDASGNLVVDSTEDPFLALAKSQIETLPQMQSAEDMYNSLAEKKEFERASKDVNRYASQINNITARAQAESLALEGQGRGITESIIGGQQAKINREAAIQALPLQALLANAQGNKELAQQQLDTVFKLRMEDAQAQYDYKSKVLGLVYDFATKAEQRKLDEVQRKEDREFQRETLSIQQEHDIRMEQIGFANSRALKQMDIAADAAKAVDTGTLTGKPQNVSQAAANGYADRLIGANSVISSIGSKFTGKTAIGNFLPNIFQTEDRQAYEQAKKNFATAVLRRESGASIAPSEFKTLNETYFPAAGDKPDVVAQKNALRNTVINSFYREANIPRPLVAGDIVDADGVSYKVGPDGFTLEEL